MSNVVERVTPDFLHYLFNGPEFYQDLVGISRGTLQDGRERSFTTHKQFLQNRVIRVYLGGERKTNLGNAFKVPCGDAIYESEITKSHVPLESRGGCNTFAYPIVNVHSHPRADLQLSYMDLNDAANSYRRENIDKVNVDLRTISAIISPISLFGHHALLLYQEKTSEPIPQDEINRIHRRKFYSPSGIIRGAASMLFFMPYKSFCMFSGITKDGSNMPDYFAVDRILEGTGLYNAYMTVFDESNGLHISEDELAKFAFETDVSGFRVNNS